MIYCSGNEFFLVFICLSVKIKVLKCVKGLGSLKKVRGLPSSICLKCLIAK